MKFSSSRKLTIVLSVLLVLLSVTALLRGEVAIGFPSALHDLLEGRKTVDAIILGELRLPRLLLAVMVGGALGLSGAVLQGYLRNPLADPALLGVSGGAALGAVSVFYTGLLQISSVLLPLGGLLGAALSTLLLVMLVGSGGALVLLLAGAALTSFAAALTALVLNLVPSPYASFEIMRWLMGSLTDRTKNDVLLALPGVVLGCGLMLTTGRALDALTLGDEVAESLGFRLRGWNGVQMRVVAGAALAVGSCVAVSGAIGFIGLVVPHVLRPLVGHRPGRLLIPSALGGAVLLLVSDMTVREVAGDTELNLGVVTALIGAPIFFHRVILFRRKGEL